VKILRVDDHTILRHGLRALLEKEMDVRLVDEAANGREAVELARKSVPEVILMDIVMPGLNGIDATRAIVAENPRAKVIGLSMNSDGHYLVAMFAAGAVGYLLKDAASTELVLAIRTVLQNRSYVSPAIAADVIECVRGAGHPALPRALTSREREVLQFLAEGKTSKEIGNTLGISVATVETHRRQMVTKLGIRTIAELTKYAVREGLTTLEK
jgi:DNA-binding NarL/FixJ family response regulator